MNLQKTTDMKTFVAKVAAGDILDEKAAEQAFNIIMSGDASQRKLAVFLWPCACGARPFLRLRGLPEL